MIDTDDVKKFIELAIECNAIEKDVNLYGIVRRLQKQYGVEIVLDSLNFFTEILIQDKLQGLLVPSIVKFCSNASKYTAIGSSEHAGTSVTWANDLDITGLDKAIAAFSSRNGPAAKITKTWTDKEVKQEITFLRVIRLEWDALKKIKKAKYENKKRQIWYGYKKSIKNVPLLLLQSQHEMRIAEYKENE